MPAARSNEANISFVFPQIITKLYQLYQLYQGSLDFMDKTYRRIPYSVPSWGWSEHMAILKGLILGRIVNGPCVEELFSVIRTLTGTPHVFGFDSGSSAITACLKASGIGSGDKVIMPSFCCHSVAEAVVRTGALPCFCEIQHDMNPDVGSILSLVGPSVKAIIFPHFFGRPGDILALDEALEQRGIRKNILLIDDAAQSFGAKINGRYLGTFGNAGIISFGAGKMTTASGGGLLLTQSKSLADCVEKLAVVSPGLAGKLQDLIYWTIFRRWRRYSIRAYRYLSFIFRKAAQSENLLFHISNIDAAIALAQMNRLERLISLRKTVAQKFEQAITEIQKKYNQSIKPLAVAHDACEESFTKYIFFNEIADNKIERCVPTKPDFYDYLKKAGIELQPLYTLLHHEPRYLWSENGLPRSEKWTGKALNLCTDTTLSQKDINFIISKLYEYFDLDQDRELDRSS